MGAKMYALVEKGNTNSFSKKNSKNISYTDSFCYRCRRVLCAAFFQESAFSLFKKRPYLFLKSEGFFDQNDFDSTFDALARGDEVVTADATISSATVRYYVGAFGK